MTDGFTVIHTPDPVVDAADRLADAVATIARERDFVRLAIPGGSALSAVGPARRMLGIVWGRTRLTWTDERCVPFEHPESNRGRAYRCGALDPASPPEKELPLFHAGERGDEAAARVEALLHVLFEGALDVLLLGMGPDGHIASIVPGHEPITAGPVAFVQAGPEPVPERITLTLPMLATAPRSVLLVTGEKKRSALERLIRGDQRLPACALRGLTVVTDLRLEAIA